MASQIHVVDGRVGVLCSRVGEGEVTSSSIQLTLLSSAPTTSVTLPLPQIKLCSEGSHKNISTIFHHSADEGSQKPSPCGFVVFVSDTLQYFNFKQLDENINSF